MARIPSTTEFNEQRIRALNIKQSEDEQILLTIDEARDVIITLLREELFLFTDAMITERRLLVEERINFKLKQIENSLLNHINNKVDSLTERIVSTTTNRIIEEEVNRRLDKKLNKLKNEL